MRVSGTYRPPKTPKCPDRSGWRGTRGLLPTTVFGPLERGRGGARRPDEALDLRRVLPARRRLDAGVDVDPPRPHRADGLAHRFGRESPRQDHTPSRRRRAGERPGDRGPRRALAPASWTVEEERGRLVAVELGEVLRVPELDRLEDWDRRGGDDLRRLGAVELDRAKPALSHYCSHVGRRGGPEDAHPADEGRGPPHGPGPGRGRGGARRGLHADR